ncbi:MAG: glycosyltransferase [Verrucomicrobia bacterium]|nr:glycosyltransferase [Verrucomicrobiota bacterium]MDA1068169.1 glycosyltransferase [Verrucomicrobiota bacterium]
MKVSVIMPVRNAASTIQRAVKSIRDQTLENWELIIVDDGSKDDTIKILEAQAVEDKRIRIHTQKPLGIVKALNIGIACSSGTLIARMDADDVSHPERLSLQSSFLNENKGIGLLGTRVNFMGNPTQQIGYDSYVEWTNSLLSSGSIRINRFIESPFAHPSVMFRRKIVGDPRLFYRSGHFPEDYELWLRLIDEGVQMAKLPEYLLDWHDSTERLSRKDPRYSPQSFYETKAKYLAGWLNQSAINRPIWIWGAGRITRKRASLLLNEGIKFCGYIDIDPRKIGGQINDLQVIRPEDIPLIENPYIVSYVGNRGAREDIRNFLTDLGLTEERDFILAA